MKVMNRSDAEGKRQKAVEFLRRIGNDELADEFANMNALGGFLIVLVILSGRLYIIEKAGLRFGRHVIRTQAEAQWCCAAGHPPRNFAEWLPRFAPTSRTGCCPHGQHAPWSIP